ncbi:hypothetical protein OG250_42600 [Streptomyces sp. NBC_00487]|uniref:hypothetical protein n=1 Tax=unclassified Streptomyces TaxID=2593676 RepID=UPI002E19FA4E|nr:MULTISPECIES: hypothetical protein [unclassified Streptomyces]
MTRIDDILSRALLVRERTVPRDVVPSTAASTTPPPRLVGAPPPSKQSSAVAAEDLRSLCETVVTHTPATVVSKFVTGQVPEPRSALVLACVLQLTDTDDGARFWWQYAAGAGQAAAAYCLYLHHLALGEDDTAAWWHRQTDSVQPPPDRLVHDHGPGTDRGPSHAWHPAEHLINSSSTTTILRILRHLAKYTVRPRPAAVTELMAYVPTAVAIGYLREPEMDLPVPGPDFADRISALLTAAAARPHVPSALPARSEAHDPPTNDPGHTATSPEPAPPETVHPQVGETATR